MLEGIIRDKKNIHTKGEPIYALLTATIDSSIYNNVNNTITSTTERYQQYCSSLRRYIEESVFTDIVFAENSGYEIDTEYFKKLANKHSKRFEYLRCPSYIKETIEYGKSYGEARLLNDALLYSDLLSEASTIYKVTGRVFLQNSKSIVKSQYKNKNEFLIVDKYNWCYTHVFKFNIKDYWKFFYKAYERIIQSRLNLEHNYYRLIIENYNDIDVGCFDYWPFVLGRQGTTGMTYTNSFKGKIYHDLLCKCNAYTHNSKLANLLTL